MAEPGGSTELSLTANLVAVPKYGENAWQHAAIYALEGSEDDPLAIPNMQLKQGDAPSANNTIDADRLLQTATHIAAAYEKRHGEVPYIAVGGKHGNACGAAVSTTPETAVQRMLDGDPRAIFGGTVLLNFAITEDIATELVRYGMPQGGPKRLLDVVIASEVTPPALDVLQRKQGKLRVMTAQALGGLGINSLDTAPRYRYIRGGLIAQDNYTNVLDFDDPEVESAGVEATSGQIDDMLLGWAIGSTSNSNTITIVNEKYLLGNGVGQQDRVIAAELAIKRALDAGHDVEGAVAYSDSFFPFPDGPQVLADAGIKAIFASRGSVKDPEIFEAMNDAGVAFYTIPDQKGRGFYGH